MSEIQNLQTVEGYIPSGLDGNIMRSSIENKNLLYQKNALYVGTGKLDEETNTYKTEAFVPTTPLRVLKVENGELVWGKIKPNNVLIATWSVVVTKAVNASKAKIATFAASASSSSGNQKNIEASLTEAENILAQLGI